jgi:NhaP-type Na+/H+ or K+/H+ antiporter
MFIAAFIAGLVVQIVFKDGSQHSIEFAEEWGQVLNLSVFFLFGLLVTQYWHQFDLASVLYAALSLTVVRMLPVAVALVGAGLSKPTVIFLGWFGPRGLASIVLGLVYLEHEIHLPGETTIRLAVMMTVLISIFAHGLTAMPGIGLYARKIKSLGPTAPEHQEVKA